MSTDGASSLPRLLRSLSTSSASLESHGGGGASLDPERSSSCSGGSGRMGGVAAAAAAEDQDMVGRYASFHSSLQQHHHHRHHATELLQQQEPPPDDLLYATIAADNSPSGTRPGFRSPVTIIANIFTCWCKNHHHHHHHRPTSTSSNSSSLHRHRHLSSAHPGLRRFAAAALLEQNRLQQEALLESQDTRDMWEWQMERQRLLTCQERDLMERISGCADLNSLLAAPADHFMAPGHLLRNASVRSERAASAAAAVIGMLPSFSDAKSNTSPFSSGASMLQDASPAWELGSPSCSSSSVDAGFQSAIALLFEATLLRCHSEINFFCRVVMQQMVLSGYSLIRTLKEMEPSAVFVKKVHTGYALESRIYAVMFRCFENDSFDETGLTRIFDPAQRAAARLQEYMRMRGVDAEDAMDGRHGDYDAAFHAFCADKSEEVMAMFSWSCGCESMAERERFTQAFVRACKWVWLLHRLAYATDPAAQIIRVGRGQELDPLYLEPLNAAAAAAEGGGGGGGGCHKCTVAKVEFMVIPGFITAHKIFHCKVYQRHHDVEKTIKGAVTTP